MRVCDNLRKKEAENDGEIVRTVRAKKGRFKPK